MTTTVIITVCVLLLLAYLFDLTASRTKVPSVIFLLLLGWGVRQASDGFGITIPNLFPILPILGTVGLILIVLEGALELEINRSKLRFVGKSALMAILPMLVLSFALAALLSHIGGVPFTAGMTNAVPLAVISSAIAIPSASALQANHREFVTYESSLSDIFGVVLFNFFALNETIGASSVSQFFGELLLMLGIAAGATVGLAFLLTKIRHHIKFGPIIIMAVLIYALAKLYHLPSLIFILLFGLFLGNLDELKNYAFIRRLHPNVLNREVHKFKELTGELAFLIRAIFFLLFGYLISTAELLNASTAVWAVGITASIFLLRIIFLKVLKLPLRPLATIAPRGLITILLFLSTPLSQSTPLVNKSLVIQVIILTALVMMTGMIFDRRQRTADEPTTEEVIEETGQPKLM